MENISELHDPKSPYFDPTLSYEAGMTTTIRSYAEGPGGTHDDPRDLDRIADAMALIATYVDPVSDTPRVLPQQSFDNIVDRDYEDAYHALNPAGTLRPIRPNRWDIQKAVRDRFNLALFRRKEQPVDAPRKPARPGKQPREWWGMGSVCLNLSPDAPVPQAYSWDEVNDYHPVSILFGITSPNGALRRQGIVAYASAYRTQYTQTEARMNPDTREWDKTTTVSPFNGIHYGFVKFFTEDCGESDAPTKCDTGCATCARVALERAVVTVRTQDTADEPDPVQSIQRDDSVPAQPEPW